MVVSGRVRVKFKLPREGGLCAVVCPILFNLRQLFSAFDLASSNFITMSTYLPIKFRLDNIFPPRFLSSVSRQHALPSPKALPFRESAMFVCHLASNNLHLVRAVRLLNLPYSALLGSLVWKFCSCCSKLNVECHASRPGTR